MTMPGDDIYDDGYPSEIAGHVEAAEDLDAVNTTHGVDTLYMGERDSQPAPQRHEGVSQSETNADIGKTIQLDKARQNPDQVNQVVPEILRCDTVVIPSVNPFTLVRKNDMRASVTITNQGVSVISVGPQTVTTPGGPGGCQIAAGASRTFTVTSVIRCVGSVGGIVDFAEESFR